MDLPVVPKPKADPPKSAIVDTASLMLHRCPISAKGLELVYTLVSADLPGVGGPHGDLRHDGRLQDGDVDARSQVGDEEGGKEKTPFGQFTRCEGHQNRVLR